MFTGIIEEVGTLVDRIEEGTSLRLQIEAERVFREDDLVSLKNGSKGSEISKNGLKLGDSIAVNGVCQTVVSVRPPIFEVIAVQETLQKTTLGSLIVEKDMGHALACPVNLERAATLATRLGGHLVQGHVDGTASIREIRLLDGSWEFYFEIPARSAKYVMPQGSITLDGVSLTVAALESSLVKAAIVPHTYYHTNFQYLKVGDEVNVEFDMIAKMVERFVL
jgi:riboflavin synthase